MGRSGKPVQSRTVDRVIASPESATLALKPRPTSSPWIFSGWQDSLLFIATPLLIIPFMVLMQRRFSDEQIYSWVIVLGASGHHFPGLLRAYGDRELFAKYRVRFIVSPIFLVGFCLACAKWSPTTLAVLVLGWGFWHGLMQVYGFIRIYDAKAGSVNPLTARLDWVFCFTFFVLGLLMSPVRFGSALDHLYAAGFPMQPVEVINGIRDGWLVLTIIAGVLFFWNMLREWRLGKPVSWVKLLTIAMSFTFWWYSQVHIQNLFLGIAMFELFHDVQYLGIVWFFNCKRADSTPNVGAFTRLLFRPSVVMVSVYIALCFAYGGLIRLGFYAGESMKTVALFGLGPASGFLHYYFDGFIWKVRDRSTRSGLGIQGSSATTLPIQRWVVHASKWLLFVIPAAILWFAGRSVPQQDYLFGQLDQQQQVPVDAQSWQVILERDKSLAATFPTVPKYQTNLGRMLTNVGDIRGAFDAYFAAAKLAPNSPDAQLDLADALITLGRKQEAEHLWARVLELDPAYADRVYLRYGWAANETKDYAEAERVLNKSLEANPNNSKSHYELARTLATTNRSDQAIKHLERALQLQPNFPEARQLLDQLRFKPAPSSTHNTFDGKDRLVLV